MFGIPNISINITTTGKQLRCSVICYNCFQSGRRVSAGLAGGEAGAGGGGRDLREDQDMHEGDGDDDDEKLI